MCIPPSQYLQRRSKLTFETEQINYSAQDRNEGQKEKNEADEIGWP